MHVDSYLEPSWDIFDNLGGHLELLEALLEPSWAILGALTARARPLPGPGEGVGGGIKSPSPPAKAVSLTPTRPPNISVAPEPQHVQRSSLDGQLLGTRTDPVRATLGPKRARHAWRARCATCSTCAKCTACSSRARRAMCGARAACARCARARDSTHRDTCRPPPSVSKTNAQSRRVAIMVSGGPAHTRPYASTPAVHVKNNLTVIAGCPRMIQIRPRSAFCICF